MSALVVPGRSIARTLGAGLDAVWVATIAVAALGHVTALRNTLTVAVALATITLFVRDWRALPCKRSVASLALWAVASVLWSVAPDTTLGKLRTDLLLPLLAGVGAFALVRDGGGLRPVVGGLIAGLIGLAALSAFAALPVALQASLPSWLKLEQFGGIVHPLPHWYPGPGDASMFTIFAIAPLTLAYRALPATGARGRRAVLVVAAVLLAFVLITTNNRNAVLVVPLVLGLQWLLDRRLATRPAHDPQAGRRRVAIAVSATVAALLIVVALLEVGARQRLEFLHRPPGDGSAALELVATDTRPMIWRYYGTRGLEHPWIGMGFGRTVPGIGWQTERDRALKEVEPNAYIHAHDVLLDWWLQLGAVGLLLLGTVLVDVVRRAQRLTAAAASGANASPAARRVHHALLVTLVATLARNLTDDFLVFGMATVFCLLVGALLGELSRLARLACLTGTASPDPRRVTSPRNRSAPS